MGIAIKKIEQKDIDEFNEFLKSDRQTLPGLMYCPFLFPHEEILVCKGIDVSEYSLEKFAVNKQLVLEKWGDSKNIYTLSRHAAMQSINHTAVIFSGYLHYKGTLILGEEEFNKKCIDANDIKEQYGEYSLLRIIGEEIVLQSDFFGMMPWYYYNDDNSFFASNNYHLLLLALSITKKELEMNIPRSRVNVITSGFMYGSPFSKDTDVLNIKINLADEEIRYSDHRGVTIRKTGLWDILEQNEVWDEKLYEKYIKLAAGELIQNLIAAVKHPRFSKVVVDVSGGFDSRIIFSLVSRMPKYLKQKIVTHTRKSGTIDDIEKASGILNIFNYPTHTYKDDDDTKLIEINNKMNLVHVSRNLGQWSVNSHLYKSRYDDEHTLEISGHSGEVMTGYMRIRGELDYQLGDRRLLKRLGGCYLHNSVDELKEVFDDQEKIILKTLDAYSSCDCLFKKFHRIYIDGRNRFIGSSRNVENNNLRIPILFSKYALKAKWMYFNQFHNNDMPKEKVTIDLIAEINPLLSKLPFTADSDKMLPDDNELLQNISLNVIPDFEIKHVLPVTPGMNRYRKEVALFMDNLEVLEQMLLHIYDYSEEYYPCCLGLFVIINEFKKNPQELKTTHGRETIRKVYDLYYQISIVSGNDK